MADQLINELKVSVRKTKKARDKADELWAEQKDLIRKVYDETGLSYAQIAELCDLTKARIWQISSHYGEAS